MTEFGRNVTNCTLFTFTVEEVNCLFFRLWIANYEIGNQYLALYPVRNNAPPLPPGQAPPQKGSCPGGRPSGPAAAAGLDFKIIPGSAP